MCDAISYLLATQSEEAKSLYPKRHLNALNTVGYKELFSYFDGQCSLTEAIEQIKIHTRQYAKRQMTWLRRDGEYEWVKGGFLFVHETPFPLFVDD